MVINAFNWRVGDIHKITDIEIRREYARRWSQELNSIIPDWYTRAPVKKWAGNDERQQKILSYYIKGGFDEGFDQLLSSK
jgi:hypothetical protein